MPKPATRFLILGFITQFVLGGLVGLAFHISLDEGMVRTTAFYIRAIIHGGLVGLGIGFTAGAFETYLTPRFARLPLLTEVVAWAIIMSLGIVVVLLAGFELVYGHFMVVQAWPKLPMIVAITLGVAAVWSTISRITRLIGSSYFVGILIGSYIRPRLESRVVLFLDMEGSTAAAERLGETRMQSMIAQFFADIDTAFSAVDGEVVSYLGDGVIVVWPASSPHRNGRAAVSLVEAKTVLDRLAPLYRKRFGTEPHFRAGLHIGTVSLAEIGGRRRQISLFGDTMNVAARLQEIAKDVSTGWVASEAYVTATSLPPALTQTPLGELTLRGRAQPVSAYALVMA